MSCALCGTPTPELDAKCTFCRARDRFWLVLDDLPSELRGWAISNLRIWTGIVQEEHEKFTTLLRQRELVNNTAAPKSAGPSLASHSPSQGRSVDPKDKAVDLKEEETRTSPPSKRAGVKEVEGVVEEEEGKHSSSSKAAKPKADTTSSRPRSRKRSRSRRRRDRSKSRRSRTRRDRSRSRKGRTNDRGEGGKEKPSHPSDRQGHPHDHRRGQGEDLLLSGRQLREAVDHQLRSQDPRADSGPEPFDSGRGSPNTGESIRVRRRRRSSTTTAGSGASL